MLELSHSCLLPRIKTHRVFGRGESLIEIANDYPRHSMRRELSVILNEIFPKVSSLCLKIRSIDSRAEEFLPCRRRNPNSDDLSTLIKNINIYIVGPNAPDFPKSMMIVVIEMLPAWKSSSYNTFALTLLNTSFN